MVDDADLNADRLAGEILDRLDVRRCDDLVVAGGVVVHQHDHLIRAGADRSNGVVQRLRVAVELPARERVDRVEVALEPDHLDVDADLVEDPGFHGHLPREPAGPGAEANLDRLGLGAASVAAAVAAGAAVVVSTSRHQSQVGQVAPGQHQESFLRIRVAAARIAPPPGRARRPRPPRQSSRRAPACVQARRAGASLNARDYQRCRWCDVRVSQALRCGSRGGLCRRRARSRAGDRQRGSDPYGGREEAPPPIEDPDRHAAGVMLIGCSWRSRAPDGRRRVMRSIEPHRESATRSRASVLAGLVARDGPAWSS